MREINPELFKWIGLTLSVLGLFASTWAIVADPNGLTNRYYARYIAHLERKLRMMFIFSPGSQVVYGQIAAATLVCGLHVAVEIPFWYLFVFGIAVIPAWYIEQMRQKRILALEEQLDGFLTALANALKSIPSIGSAFNSIGALLQPPMKDEVDLALKEMRVGNTLDQALLNMAGRIGSRQLDSALSAILIGKQLGGDLPRILETTASTMREMSRLEGVVKSKTAEGKAQMWVLAVFPFLMALALNWTKEGYFEPLSQSIVGYIIAFAAGFFWLASIVVARKVLAVDI